MKWKGRQNRGRRRSSWQASLPVFLAACLLVLAAGCLAQHRLSARRQAAELIQELYTADREPMLKELALANMSSLYERRWGDRITEEGKEALLKIGVPYSLLFWEFSAPVEQTYTVSVKLEEEEPGPAKPQEKAVSFRYTVEVDFYLEKGLEVLPPIEQEVYTGTIRLKKSGLFEWRLDGFTVG